MVGRRIISVVSLIIAFSLMFPMAISAHDYKDNSVISTNKQTVNENDNNICANDISKQQICSCCHSIQDSLAQETTVTIETTADEFISGRAITAIRDNEIAAKSTGINVTQYKLVGFIVAAIFAGLAGVLFSYTQNNVSSSTFDYNYSIEILVMVVLGGMGNVNGSILSAALITYLNKELATTLTGDLAVLKDLVYALILITIVIYNNAPALKNVREKYSIKNLFHKITKNKFLKKTETDDSGRWDVVPTKIKMDALLSTDFIVNDPTPDKPSEKENNNE